MSKILALPHYSAIYAFGDSLSDAGNASFATALEGQQEPVSPPYFSQSYGVTSESVFSSGAVWVQDLATSLGLGTLAPSLLGGNDFAVGGAETGTTAAHATNETDLPGQIALFGAATGSTADPSALYTVWIGSNDIFSILDDTALTATEQQGAVAAAVSNEMASLSALVGDGAKDLLVLGVPDLGVTPAVTSLGSAAEQAASGLSQLYNADLVQALDSLSSGNAALDINYLDTYALIDQAVANPASYGFTDATDPDWDGNYTDGSSGRLATDNPNDYLFFDSVHPTGAGHALIARAALAELEGNACFAAGTRIATARGGVAVEALSVGDLVETHRRGRMVLRPIVWIGWRHVDLARHRAPELAAPIRIAAGALAEGAPLRDLLVSRDHCLLIDGRLVLAERLVNGTSIRRETAARAVQYFHLELAEHDILMAEGVLTESYLDTGNRAMFSNAGTPPSLHPAFSAPKPWTATCVPICFDEDYLAFISDRLARRASLLASRAA